MLGEKQRSDLVSLLKTALNHLIENCYFNVGNVTTKQELGIWMGIEPAPFWANLFIFLWRRIKHSPYKIKLRHLYSTKYFIDDIFAINDEGEFRRFVCDTYPKELEGKVKQKGDHAIFLNLRSNKKVIMLLFWIWL